MIFYLMNSPVLTEYGSYRFSGPLEVEAARAHLQNGFISVVGHQSTADLLAELLDLKVPVSRASIRMQPADRAIVFRLLDRVAAVEIEDVDQLKIAGFELAMLERTE